MTDRSAGPAVLLAIVVGVAGCSGKAADDKPSTTASSSTGSPVTPSPSGSSSPTTGTEGLSAAQRLTEQLLTGTDTTAAVATVRGTIATQGGGAPIVAEILQVRANAATTLLRWRVKSQSGKSVNTFGDALSPGALLDTRAVTLIDKAAKQALSPFTYNENQADCVCSDMPQSVGGDGEPLYALYPALGASTGLVDVKLPGFPVAKNIPVTRE